MAKENNIDDIQIDDVFFESPLDAPTVDRVYSKVEADSSIGDIPEPEYVNEAPKFEDESEQIEVEIEQEPSPFESIKNPAMEELSGKEKKESASQLVTTILDAYKMSHQLFVKVASINKNKVTEKVMSGDIDINLSVPVSEDGTSVNAVEYADVYNEQVEELLGYDPEFDDKVRPAMERVFAKKGWGMTDEQFLMVAFGKDIATKGIQMLALRKQGNQMIEQFAKLSKQYRQAQPEPQVVTPDSYEKPTKQEKPKAKPTVEVEDVEEITTDDIERELNDEN